MQRFLFLVLIRLLFSGPLCAQDHFNYTPELVPVSVPGLPGIHSYAFAQHNGKWLIIGGRLDGIHARQPFNAFPASQNNTELFVVDIKSGKFWKSGTGTLAPDLQEQLQSTNMNFFQDADTLVIIGGYGYSKTTADHITFPNLTTVRVKALINAIINNKPIAPYFKQITDSVFAVTGGHLSKLNDEYYLIGGHRFMGRYNPMLGPTFVQTYTNEIRKFKLNNKNKVISFSGYTVFHDDEHLHRRDYNLLPQIFPDGSEGFTIASGVFQYNFDLPFLYPVNINQKGYFPQTDFYQYLSNYHSPNVNLYDEKENEMHTVFFGGMSQYYYQDSLLIQDNDVPFVNTISQLTRFGDSTLQEYELPYKMPGLMGASGEFIPNHSLPYRFHSIIDLKKIKGDSFVAGYIYGGIKSSTINPFANNSPEETAADTCIYMVRFTRSDQPVSKRKLDGKNPYSLQTSFDTVTKDMQVKFKVFQPGTDVSYILTTDEFDLVTEKVLVGLAPGEYLEHIKVDSLVPGQICNLTFTFNNMFYETKRVVIE